MIRDGEERLVPSTRCLARATPQTTTFLANRMSFPATTSRARNTCLEWASDKHTVGNASEATQVFSPIDQPAQNRIWLIWTYSRNLSVYSSHDLHKSSCSPCLPLSSEVVNFRRKLMSRCLVTRLGYRKCLISRARFVILKSLRSTWRRTWRENWKWSKNHWLKKSISQSKS